MLIIWYGVTATTVAAAAIRIGGMPDPLPSRSNDIIPSRRPAVFERVDDSILPSLPDLFPRKPDLF